MIACIPEAQVESIARVLGECGTGSEITRVLLDRQLVDGSGESTKWKRLYWVFLDSQKTYNCANRMLDFIQAFLAPSRFVGRQEVFEERRNELNEVLALSGLELRTDGICQTSCPLISCGVSDFRGAVFVFGVEPDWSSRLPVSGFA